MNDSELDRLLQALHSEELPAAALAEVRAGVREKLARRRMRFAAWLWAPAGVAVAALALIVLTPAFRPAPALKVAVRAPAGPGIEMLRKAPAVPLENAAIAPRASRGNSVKTRPGDGENRALARSGEPQQERTEFIKMYTDDPDVVILWAMNSKGETR
ncbi:MAG: hypothetical protein ACLQBJ_10880 [Bryobacteraceae bacterium]